MLNLNSYLKSYNNIPIKGPIFLLGNQGDGLTLLSRMLRRNPSVVSVTGNCHYWAGADEMQNVYELILPSELSGIRFKAPSHPMLTPPRSWSYACNELIDKYRNTEKDTNEYFEIKLRHAIGLAISRYAKNIKNPRFVDKSQVYTVKMSFIYKLLEDCGPYFIFVTRNPYVSCYRAAIGKAADMKRYAKFMHLDERVKICVEHWLNSVQCIEEDKRRIKNFMTISFENLIKYPRYIMKQICNFVNLKYSDNMIPQPYQKLPFGIKFKDRWYPIRPDVNEQYLKKIPYKYIKLVYEKCGKYAALYGYTKPKGKK